jgi:hypothetical protein
MPTTWTEAHFDADAVGVRQQEPTVAGLARRFEERRRAVLSGRAETPVNQARHRDREPGAGSGRQPGGSL